MFPEPIRTIRPCWPLSLCTLVCVFATGCGNPAGTTGTTDVNSDTLRAPSLTSINREALDEASAAFMTLLETHSVDDARTELLAHLPNHYGIVRAELCADGYTIWVDFADGQVAAIAIDDVFSMSEQNAKSAMPVIRSRFADDGSRPAAATPSWQRTLRALPDGLAHYPASREVLLMSAAAETFAGQDLELFESIRDILIDEYNWAPGDITIKRNELVDEYATLNFYDFFRLGDYGVIVILAHSIFRDEPPPSPVDTPSDVVTPPEDNSDPFNFGFRVAGDYLRYFYIQVGAEWADPTDSDPFDFGFRVFNDASFDVTEEMRRGRIVLVDKIDVFNRSHRAYYYMREDLWAEQVEELPNSLVYVCAPNYSRQPTPSDVVTPPTDNGDPYNFGFRVIDEADAAATNASALAERGAGAVLGWDYLVPAVNVLNTLDIIPAMARDDASDAEALESGSVETAVAVPAGSSTVDAHLTLYPYDNGAEQHLFLPTWADVSFGRVPDDTRTVKVTLAYADATVPWPAVTVVEDIPHAVHEFDGLFPGVVAEFTAETLDSGGRRLSRKEKTVTLHSGGNNVVFGDFATYETDEIEVPVNFIVYGPVRISENHLFDWDDWCGEWIIYGYAYTWETPDEEDIELLSWRYAESPAKYNQIPKQLLTDGTTWEAGTDYLSILGVDPTANYIAYFYASGLCFCNANNCHEEERMENARNSLEMWESIAPESVFYQYRPAP